MDLVIGNVYTSFAPNNSEEDGWISQFLTFETPPTYYQMGGRIHVGDTGRIRLYDIKKRRFPTGLAAMVIRAAKQQNFKVNYTDARAKPCELDEAVDLSWLYDFQLEAVRRAYSRSRGILHLPTGSGKAEIAIALAKAIPVKWLMVAPEKDLMHNLADRWDKRTGEKVGRIGDGIWEEADRVNVATFQTLSRAMESKDLRFQSLVQDVGGFIVDEVHQAPSDTYFKVCMAIPNAYWRLGFSGTPLSRGDKKSPFAIGATGEVIYRLSPQVLIDRGYISRPEITMVRVTQGAPSAKTYTGAYKEMVVRSKTRNNAVIECVAQAQKPCLVFVQYTNHGKELKDLLSKKHPELRVQYIHGTHSTKQRDQVIDALKWGDVDVLIASKILQTGTDIPDLRSLVVATAGASNIAALQRLGRGMRVLRDSDGHVIKDSVEIYDIYDVDAKAVNPHTGRKRATKMKWFEKHAEERLAWYKCEGYPVNIK